MKSNRLREFWDPGMGDGKQQHCSTVTHAPDPRTTSM
jgi:hypothetical protein